MKNSAKQATFYQIFGLFFRFPRVPANDAGLLQLAGTTIRENTHLHNNHDDFEGTERTFEIAACVRVPLSPLLKNVLDA